MRFDTADDVMQHAIGLAERGLGRVEPNPPVGAVVVAEEDGAFIVLGEGWHREFGGPHAEVEALRDAGDAARGATMFVTLEPCCHTGKTPPCSRALIDAGIARVVIGTGDPAPHVDGGGIAELRGAGLDVQVCVAEEEARALITPFVQLQTDGRPWVHAKWAMSLDGRIATRTGHSQWISGEASRARVHELRGRMDAIVVGAGTARADNPRLTARPPGPRTPLRVVVDSRARLPLDSHLVRTATKSPVLLCTTNAADAETLVALERTGVEVLQLPGEADEPARVDVDAMLCELGRRQLTHVLVEGGGRLLGSLFDAGRIDEVHVFIAPKLIGGETAVAPVGGLGLEHVPTGSSLQRLQSEGLGSDVYISGRLEHAPRDERM